MVRPFVGHRGSGLHLGKEELPEHLSVQHETEKITVERRSRVGDQQRTARIRPLAIGGSAGSALHYAATSRYKSARGEDGASQDLSRASPPLPTHGHPRDG
eukprot:TRINITY_DN608_c0_g1_i2.p2 TRINITY_DN608_c0_g1~~TRINITY_DN608_c0_g1_i2.p2  ORF type:complete len:101 (+),score=1.98 TRINITY_DN608_c0_g1_i2:405-707(+)